jgi:PBP1b-binding outer membrane lipoprotein LpoB
MARPHLAVLAVSLLALNGCSSKPEPKAEVKEVVKIVDNPEKDRYIDRVEHEASEAAAALIAAKPGVSPPHSKLVELTTDRMSGLKKPTQEQVKKYEDALKSEAAMKAEKEKASKVDAETTALYDRVEKVDSENKDLKEKLRLLEEQRQADIRQEAYEDLRDMCLLLCAILTVAGVGIALIGYWMGKGIKAGVLVSLAGLSVGAAPLVIQDIVESAWFKWTVGTIVVAGIAYGIYELFDTDVKVRRKKASERPGEVPEQGPE